MMDWNEYKERRNGFAHCCMPASVRSTLVSTIMKQALRVEGKLVELAVITGRDIDDLTLSFDSWIGQQTCSLLEGVEWALSKVAAGEDCPF